MGVITNIKAYKIELRKKYRKLREDFTPEEKRERDGLLFDQIVNSKQYREAKTLLCFVSTGIEVDTHRLIYSSLRKGKTVAVPRCLNNKGEMDFFIIQSMNDLEKGAFSLLEPNLELCPRLTDYRDALCIVPGFSFDPEGYRLGYGKGYYDRFLSRFTGVKIGICYNNCISPKLPHGRFDVPVDFLFTEKYIKRIK